MAIPVFDPPHPVAVFRLLKQSWREYLASGNAAGLDVDVIPNQAASAPTVVSGVVHVDRSAYLPAIVYVDIASASPAIRQAPVNRATGVWTTTYPGNSMLPGSAQATCDALDPRTPFTNSNVFTVT